MGVRVIVFNAIFNNISVTGIFRVIGTLVVSQLHTLYTVYYKPKNYFPIVRGLCGWIYNYSMQHYDYVIKFVSDLQQVSGFLRVVRGEWWQTDQNVIKNIS
jgi:hypothetical protein